MNTSTLQPQLMAACLLLAVTSGPLLGQTSVFYVDAGANGSNLGSSWADAWTDLQSALAAATNGDEIRVAAGTYTPSASDRSVSFVLVDGVALLGGFPLGGGLPASRDPDTHETILSGDLAGNDDAGSISENAYHVVVAGIGVGNSATLDGFVISGGNANGPQDPNGGGMMSEGAPYIRRCIFEGNRADGDGGGLYITGMGVLMNTCRFLGNSATRGGGMHTRENSGYANNCLFSGNAATSWGGGIYSNPLIPFEFEFCTIANNTAISLGGGLRANGATFLNASILWGNSSANLSLPVHAQISSIGQNPNVVNSIIQSYDPAGFPVLVGSRVLDEDPRFSDALGPDNQAGTRDDDLRPRAFAGIDAGRAVVLFPGTSSVDINGNPREVDLPHVANSGSNSGFADWGCYELTVAEGRPLPGTNEDLILESSVRGFSM